MFRSLTGRLDTRKSNVAPSKVVLAPLRSAFFRDKDIQVRPPVPSALGPLTHLRWFSPMPLAASIVRKVRAVKRLPRRDEAPPIAKPARVQLAELSKSQIEDERDEEDLSKLSPNHAARMRERARIMAIMQSPAAKGRESAAASLALKSRMPRHAAIRFLEKLPMTQQALHGGLPRDEPYRITRAS